MNISEIETAVRNELNIRELNRELEKRKIDRKTNSKSEDALASALICCMFLGLTLFLLNLFIQSSFLSQYGFAITMCASFLCFAYYIEIGYALVSAIALCTAIYSALKFLNYFVQSSFLSEYSPYIAMYAGLYLVAHCIVRAVWFTPE